MRTWVKLYTEINRDPKILRLTWAQRGIWCALLALAGEIDDEDENGLTGLLGSEEDVALLIRCDEAEFAEALTAFEARGMIYREDGLLYLAHFGDRQREKPSSQRERVAQRVQRHRRATGDGQECNAPVTPSRGCYKGVTEALHGRYMGVTSALHNDVTPLKHPVTPSDTETETDTDTDTETEADPPYIPPTLARGGEEDASLVRGNSPLPDRVAADLQKTLERAGIFVGSEMQFEAWRTVLEEDAGGDLDLFTQSLLAAIRQNKRTAAYVGGIARRCREQNRKPGDRAAPNRPLAGVDEAIRLFREGGSS